jgi:hypothetical protein
MTYAIDKISGGQYSGSGAKPDSAIHGAITTNGAGRLCVMAFFTSRVLNSLTPDYHRVASVSASGLTFTKIVDEDFTYNDPVNSASFPNIYYHCDVFVADCPSQLTNLAWSTTMAAAADTFVNDGWACVMTVDGKTALDSDPSNLVVDSSLTGSAAVIDAGPLSTTSAQPLVLLAMFGHDSPVETIGLPSGFATTFSGAGGNSQFSTDTSAGARANIALCFKEESSQLSGQTYASSTQHIDTWSVAIALSDGAPPAPSHAFGVVIT